MCLWRKERLSLTHLEILHKADRRASQEGGAVLADCLAIDSSVTAPLVGAECRHAWELSLSRGTVDRRALANKHVS